MTEAGDFSLKELCNSRRELKDSKAAPYEPEEVIAFLKHILPAYEILRKCKIYHSDTKLDNIVYSHEKKGYFLIDFGIANVISEEFVSNGVCMSEFVRGGTDGYLSPEKEFFSKQDDYIEEEQDIFDPYKCDLWSLGKCLIHMASPIDEKKKGALFLKNLIEQMTLEDWRLRLDVFKIREILESYMLPDCDFLLLEQTYTKKLKKKRQVNYMETINTLINAGFDKEALALAYKQRRKIEKRVGVLSKGNILEFEENIRSLG